DRAMYPRTVIWQEQEPGSGGKEQAETQVLDLAGYVVNTERVTGDKSVRATPLASQAFGGDGVGNVKVCEGDWNEAFLAEIEMFPRGTFKDQVDATSGAFNKLTIPVEEKPDGVTGYNPAAAVKGSTPRRSPFR